MTEIVIGYHEDAQAEIQELARDIELCGFKVWFDYRPAGGEQWWDQVLTHIRECSAFVLAVTAEGLNSNICQFQLRYASDLRKSVLPVLVADKVKTESLPQSLSRTVVIDYSKNERRAGIELAKALLRLPAPIPLPEPLPQAPPIPISHLVELEKEVGTATVLGYERQCVLLIKLGRSVRDPATASEGYILLERLRNRDDIEEENREEVEEILLRRECVSAPEGVRPAPSKRLPDRSRTFPKTSRATEPSDGGKGDSEKKTGRPLACEGLIKAVADGVLLDSETKLMWTEKDNGHHVNWFTASDYAESLRLGGYTDWRLPTVEELASLYDSNNPGQFKVKYPVALSHRFVWGTKQEEGRAGYFDFSYGSRRSAYLDDVHHRVLCVRGSWRILSR